MITLAIGADIYPTECNREHFINGDVKKLVDDKIYSYLNEADFRIYNLETPLYEGCTPIKKCGPALCAPIASVKGIKDAFNPTVLGICNNHVLDHGSEGFYSTTDALDKAKIPYAGAGDNLADAQKPYILEKDGKKVGLYFCAEHEFSIATEKSCGVNPFEPLDSLDHIADLKEKCDYVIVLYHGGKEEYRYPTKNLQKRCQRMADKGADVVICQHTHCVGCEEDYKGSKIIYGQGNLIFNKHNNEFWNSGLIVKVILDDGVKCEYLPIGRTETGIYTMDGDEANEITNGFKVRSEEIKEPGFIEKAFTEYANTKGRWYIYRITGGETVHGKFDDYKIDLKEGDVMALINYITCEPHVELLQTVLNDLI